MSSLSPYTWMLLRQYWVNLQQLHITKQTRKSKKTQKQTTTNLREIFTPSSGGMDKRAEIVIR